MADSGIEAALGSVDAWERLARMGVRVSVRSDLGAPDGLMPTELAAVRTARDTRRREFASGRAAARRALAELGLEGAAIPRADTREPIWPDGVTGSITHCDGCCAAAVAWKDRVAGIGIDVEPHEPLPRGTLGLVTGADERNAMRRLERSHPGIAWDRLMFSCKEAAFKAWFPFHRDWLGFDAVRVVVDVGGQAFDVTARRGDVRGPRPPLVALRGHWSIGAGFIRTAVAISSTDAARWGWRRAETSSPGRTA
jgi:4'-phosphopantetheinyl transferase EntD